MISYGALEVIVPLCVVLIFQRCHARQPFEIFGEERRGGEVHLFGNLGSRLVGMPQFYFDAGDNGAVYPVFGCGAAGLPDDGTEVAFGEAQAMGIVAYLVVLCAMQVGQLDKTVEDGLLTRL